MHRNLKTVRQLADQGPWTEGQLRWMIFNSASNGLAKAVVRFQGRVLLDVDELEACIAEANPQHPQAAA